MPDFEGSVKYAETIEKLIKNTENEILVLPFITIYLEIMYNKIFKLKVFHFLLYIAFLIVASSPEIYYKSSPQWISLGLLAVLFLFEFIWLMQVYKILWLVLAKAWCPIRLWLIVSIGNII